MTAVALHSFSRRRKQFAKITAWTMFATYVIFACEKNGLEFSGDGQESVRSVNGTDHFVIRMLI